MQYDLRKTQFFFMKRKKFLDIPWKICYNVICIRMPIQKSTMQRRWFLHMNIALVDDSAADRNSLKLYLHVYLKKHRITAELEEFTCAEEYLEAAQHRTFDVVFLDI